MELSSMHTHGAKRAGGRGASSRELWRAGLLVLALSACTARNPAFEAPSVATPEADAEMAPAPSPDAAVVDREPVAADASPAVAATPDAALADLAPDTAPIVDVAPDLAPDLPVPVHALLVVGDTALSKSDAQLRAHLESAGFVVTAKDSGTSATSDASGKSLVVISGSAVSEDVNSKFRDVPVPVVVFDDAVFGPMKLTGTKDGTDYGSILDEKRVAIVDPSNPMAAGLSGTITVTNDYIEVSWGVPSTSAIRVASVAGQSSHYTLFAYDAGTTMVGMTAPARRVGAFVRFPDTASYTDAGLLLIDAIVRWAVAPY